MHLKACQGRVEYTNHSQRLFATPQPMLIILVEGIDDSWAQGVFLAVSNGFDFAIPFYAPCGFEVVLIVDMRFSTGEYHGLVKREAHTVLLQQHSPAEPVFRYDLVFGTYDFVDIPYDHRALPPNFNTWALTPFSANASATLRSMISSPRESRSSSIVSAGRTLRTSSCAPEVSITRPYPNAF